MQPPGLPSLVGVPKHPPTCLDDVVPQPNDQGVGAIGLELIPKLVKDLVELGQVPCPDSWREEGGNEGRRKAGKVSQGWLTSSFSSFPSGICIQVPSSGENSHCVPSHSGYSVIL